MSDDEGFGVRDMRIIVFLLTIWWHRKLVKFYFYENVKREGYRLLSLSEFWYKVMRFVEKEGPAKKYDS